MENDEIKQQTMFIRDMKTRLFDILLLVSWGRLAKLYLGQKATWLYYKMNGVDDKGNVEGFTTEEAEKLKKSLYDLSNRIRIAADNI